MTVKTVILTAETVEYEEIRLRFLVGGQTYFDRDYTLLDGAGEPIPEIQQFPTVTGIVEWADIPVDIQNALTTINDFVNARVAEQENFD